MTMTEVISCQSGSRLEAKLDEDDNAAPPALPPRPPPRPRNTVNPALNITAHLKRKRVKKYVFLCSVCGGLASLLGSLFLAVYLILRTYTSSLDYFETIPTYIPAAMLMVTGLAVMCLARRRNRYIFLIKLCGLCCLMCVGTCVLVTVTTTVVHMNRLQSLRECVYTLKTQTCTCYSVLLESASERTDEGSRYVFNATPDCEAIHGALYSCLRALFGLSVIGILVCIFCCMLVYQLLSHERKKMYWEQLELRCRYLYGQVSNPVRTNTLAQPTSSQPTQHCACCQQFRYQQDILAWESSDNRFWSGGQVGNLYSPNPVGEECMAVSLSEPSSSGWSWRRLPWTRQATNTLPLPTTNSHRSSNGYHRPLNCSSPDSQYGFSSEPGHVATVSSGSASYTVIDPVAQSSSTNCNSYHWGPPPPYSDPNSPSRPVPCLPGSHHHHWQRSTTGEGHNDNESCRVLQLRIPSRRSEIPQSSSSSSSIKSSAVQNSNDLETNRPPRMCQKQEVKPIQKTEDSNWHDCSVSPRIKYFHNKLQNSLVNTSQKLTHDLSESEVYFADVSSCNVSVRNDSLSVYGETSEVKNTERVQITADCLHEVREELNKKHTQSPSTEENSILIHNVPHTAKDVSRSAVIMSPKPTNFQGNPSRGESSYSGVVLDCSEDEDPELVNLSQQASLRGRIPYYRNENITKSKNEPHQDIIEASHKSQNEFPSSLSISSPSTISKVTGGFYAKVLNSDNGSSDSVWSGYSADLLAPDAQYEVIPDHTLVSVQDLNGNPNETIENPSKVRYYLLPKKRQYPYKISESWSVNNTVCSANQEFIDTHSFNRNNINSKSVEKSKDIACRNRRSNEQCLSDILNSSKSTYRNTRSEAVSNSNTSKCFNSLTRSTLPPVGDEEPLDDIYCAINENDKTSSDRTDHSFVCDETPEMLNSQKVSNDILVSSVKLSEREKLSNVKHLNFSETGKGRNCFHSDSNCKCFASMDLPNNELNHVRPVDV